MWNNKMFYTTIITKLTLYIVLKCGAGEGWRRSVGPIM
jgi:hypothetical protein